MLIDQGDDIEAVAARLKAIREALGLNKRDFAAMTKTGEGVYGMFENAKRPLTLEAAKNIRKRFNIGLDFLTVIFATIATFCLL